MIEEVVTVLADGQPFGAVKHCELEAAFHHAAHAFSFEVMPSPALLTTFAPGTPLQIMGNGDVMFTGFVDRLQLGFRRFVVSGRSKTQDLIDCSAIDAGGTGNFQNQNLLQIAQGLAQPFGVRVTTDQQLDQIEDYQLVPGESPFAACERLARPQGLTLSAQYDGSLKITRPGTQRHAGGLFQGQPPLRSLEADLDWSHLHSPVIVRGQSPTGTDSAALQVEAKGTNADVWGDAPPSTPGAFTGAQTTAGVGAGGRYRPLVHVEDSAVDGATAQTLADARSQREAGEAIKATAMVAGFRDQAGTLWTPGWLVWVESPLLGLCQALMIKRVKFSQHRNGGSTARLELVDPRAFGGNAAKGSSPAGSPASSIWNAGAGASTVPAVPGLIPG